jgi:hypothetical protein
METSTYFTAYGIGFACKFDITYDEAYASFVQSYWPAGLFLPTINTPSVCSRGRLLI